MVSIRAENLSLRYPLPFKFGLSSRRQALPSSETAVGGLVNRQDRGRKRNIDALRDVSFELEAGDRLGLVGNNGAGKTTLLKTLYGIYPPTGGAVRTTGRVDALFNINLGFRREATGRRNITLRGLINGWSPELIAAQMEEIIEFSELGEFIDLPFKAYSSGMAARLAFAMATSFKPEILLMDEWIGAGDKSFQKKAKGRMDAIAAEAGIIVLASHNNKLLQRTCNKILVLEKGMVKSFGSAAEHFAEPSNSDEDYLS